EKPKGAGLSEARVAEGEGREGGKALKIVGRGKRGLAMQVRPSYPGRYRVAGWIKCENLEAGHAGVLAEWMDRQNKWMRGDWAVQVSGTQDWKRFEAVVEAPAGTRSVHFDLITTEPNNGTVWFDDVEFQRLPSALPTPQAPSVAASTPAGRERCLEVTWDPKTLINGTVRLLIYCEPEAKFQDALPRVVADSEDGRAIVWSLATGTEYHVAAAAVNADGQCSAIGPAISAVVTDKQSPRPGWIEARRSLDGQVQVSWSPHLLDKDVKSVGFSVLGETGSPLVMRAMRVAELRHLPRPLFYPGPWLSVQLKGPEGATKAGVWCEDEAGNRGELALVDIQPARAASESAAPCALWVVPPTEQVRRDAEPPADATTSFELTLMRGQAKGFQVVLRPQEPMRRVRVSFEPLVFEDGPSPLDSYWFTYHFVNYVRIEKNSRATPKDELVWPGPGEYPDELSDDLVRDLPAGQTQPIFVRIAAQRDVKPGLYRGRGYVDCDSGRRAFDMTVRVAPVDLPEMPHLKFVYWFSWADPCKQFGVEQFSEDGWRVLARLGELMRTHHQNVVVVPYSLVRTWRKSDGALAHDFRDFDRFVRTFQAQGVGRLFCLSHVGSRTTGEWECPTMSSHRHTVRRLDTGETEQMDVIDLLPALEQHVAQLGLLDRFCVHVADEPTKKNVESYRELSARVKQAAPRLARIDAIHVSDLQGSLEIWVPQLNYFEQWLDQYRAAKQQGAEMWFYVAWVPQGRYPNRMIDSHVIKSRVLHWLNALYDTTGYLHWALNYWRIPLTSLESPGDQYICWPSRRFIANSSLRYEAEREGLEDCELMFMLRYALEKRGVAREEAQRQVEGIARKAVRSFQDYTRSWRELEDVRLELLRQAAQLASAPK
ncbi:MAG: DUF4091 domain-containing protein, partial [Planctomycetes bacterium]|nr:DUF4091 domain-containing protein [Planctomycetota bacterium]